MMMSGSASSDDLLPCANPNCAHLMLRDYLCIGCGQPVHWFCAAGNPADNEKGHGSHYWYPPCNLKKSNTSSALLVSWSSLFQSTKAYRHISFQVIHALLRYNEFSG
jgi:hypothetical protein